MENVLDSIRVALDPAASPEVRAAGAAACRAILANIEPASASAPVSPATSSPTPQQVPVAAIAAALRGKSTDQVLDLAIAKLRSMLPADVASTAVVPAMRIPIVPVRTP